MKTTKDIIQFFTKNNLSEIGIIRDGDQYKISDARVIPLLLWFNRLKQLQGHEFIYMALSPTNDFLYIIAVHSTKAGQSIGGIRLKNFETADDGINEVLSLSIGMSKKNVEIPISMGGGKSIVLAKDTNTFKRLKTALQNDISDEGYATLDFIASCLNRLQATYIAGKDENISSDVMVALLARSLHVSCLNEKVGGVKDVSEITARWVFAGIKGSIFAIHGAENIAGKRILVKGVCGSVGTYLAKLLVKEGAIVYGYDIAEKLSLVKPEDGIIPIYDYNEFLSMEAEVLSPNASSQTVDEKVLELFKGKIICGAENSQLKNPEIAEELFREKGIYLIPEYLLNSGGVYAAYMERTTINLTNFIRHEVNIYNKVIQIIQTSEQEKISPYAWFESKIYDKINKGTNTNTFEAFVAIFNNIAHQENLTANSYDKKAYK